jgi:hypothetical protein
MALQFNAPDWLIQDYLARKNQNLIAGSINQAANQYLRFDESNRRNRELANESVRRDQETAMKGREQFYKYGDQMGIPPEIRGSLGQPVQGPSNVVDIGDGNTAMVPPAMSPVIQSFNDWRTKFPQGSEGAKLDNVSDFIPKIDASGSVIGMTRVDRSRYGKTMAPTKPQPTKTEDDKAPAGYRWTKDKNLEPIPGGPADAKTNKENSKIDTVYELYETARDGLVSAMDKTTTGPILGRMPALTANQQTADATVAAMAPVLKQLFRVAGEGVFTDRDQALLLDMVTKRTEHPEARKEIVENMDNIIRAKLGKGPRSQPTQGGPQVGEVRKGYRFKGGNPADRNSWEPAQ